MREYIPTLGPLPGTQWIPSNGTEGDSFLSLMCSNCARDKAMREGEPIEECDDNECCPIIGASFRSEAVEWRRMPDGEVTCLSFIPAGEPIPPPRCTNTVDMFEPTDQQQGAG